MKQNDPNAYRAKLRALAEERAEMMWHERQDGASLSEIAARHGVTRQRVHQILYGEAPFPPKRPMGKPPPREDVSTHSERTA